MNENIHTQFKLTSFTSTKQIKTGIHMRVCYFIQKGTLPIWYLVRFAASFWLFWFPSGLCQSELIGTVLCIQSKLTSIIPWLLRKLKTIVFSECESCIVSCNQLFSRCPVPTHTHTVKIVKYRSTGSVIKNNFQNHFNS